MWDGKKDGKKVGGPIYKAICPNCQLVLIAFADVLDKTLIWKDESSTLPRISN